MPEFSPDFGGDYEPCPEDTRTKVSMYRDRHREPHDPNRGSRLFLRCERGYPGQTTRAPSPCWRF
jgi:hypothetical protein